MEQQDRLQRGHPDITMNLCLHITWSSSCQAGSAIPVAARVKDISNVAHMQWNAISPANLASDALTGGLAGYIKSRHGWQCVPDLRQNKASFPRADVAIVHALNTAQQARSSRSLQFASLRLAALTTKIYVH